MHLQKLWSYFYCVFESSLMNEKRKTEFVDPQPRDRIINEQTNTWTRFKLRARDGNEDRITSSHRYVKRKIHEESESSGLTLVLHELWFLDESQRRTRTKTSEKKGKWRNRRVKNNREKERETLSRWSNISWRQQEETSVLSLYIC